MTGGIGREGGEAGGGVDLYVGGTEHAVLHLLYARFWHKVLFDLGHVSHAASRSSELVNQGLILGEDGQKMSKSPRQRGQPRRRHRRLRRRRVAAATRCSWARWSSTKPWSMTGVEGVLAFPRPRLAAGHGGKPGRRMGRSAPPSQDVPMPDKPPRKVIHATIKKVGEDIEALSFNTAIAQMMIFVNAFTGANPRPRDRPAPAAAGAQSLRPASHRRALGAARLASGARSPTSPWPDLRSRAPHRGRNRARRCR